VFWLSVGAVGGYYAARRGERLVQEAKERGLVGNVTLAATTATRVATSATRTAVSLGEAAGARTRGAASARDATAGPTATPRPGTTPTATSRTS
jgi:hypothetical protein